MAGPSDQDKLSDDWNLDEALGAGADIAEATEEESSDAEMSAEWAAMLEGGGGDGEGDAVDRVLNQDEIDSLLGFDANAGGNVELTGVQALINSALVSYERLPMLEIVF
ncbi:MAG: flagellar motor switch protein FliM, partial [Devosia sp.]